MGLKIFQVLGIGLQIIAWVLGSSAMATVYHLPCSAQCWNGQSPLCNASPQPGMGVCQCPPAGYNGGIPISPECSIQWTCDSTCSQTCAVFVNVAPPSVCAWSMICSKWTGSGSSTRTCTVSFNQSTCPPNWQSLAAIAGTMPPQTGGTYTETGGPNCSTGGSGSIPVGVSPGVGPLFTPAPPSGTATPSFSPFWPSATIAPPVIPSPTASPFPSVAPIPSASPSPSASPVGTPPTASPTADPTPTLSPTPTATPTPTPSLCALPEEPDGAGGCHFVPNHHRCDDGSVSGLASAVSNEITGTSATAKFNNVMNKKLACCLNRFNPGDAYQKFDCVENSKKTYTNFDQLWTSDDGSADTQMNAIVLANSQGKPLSGFYTLSGTRCNEYSEFGGELRPARVNPVISATRMNHASGTMDSDAIEYLAAAEPLPSSTAYTQLKTGLGSTAKVPTTAAERRRCPILVRAALVAQCPTNPMPPATKRNYVSGGVVRCPDANAVAIHIRVEQLTEISGTPKMETVDTVLHPRAASAISIERILSQKYGNQCPPGTHSLGDACVDD